MTGKVDLVIAVMGMYPERAKVVQFSKPYAALSIIVLGKKSANIKGVRDLAGLTVGVTRGAAQDTALTAQARNPPISAGSTTTPRRSRRCSPDR